MGHFQEVKKTRAALAAAHPYLFNRDAPVPLKIGIASDIFARYPGIDRAVCGTIFAIWTRRRAYLKACTAGARRFGLDGPDGEVGEGQATWAAAMFRKRQDAEEAKISAAIAAAQQQQAAE